MVRSRSKVIRAKDEGINGNECKIGATGALADLRFSCERAPNKKGGRKPERQKKGGRKPAMLDSSLIVLSSH
jgi:hypothetical protein